jgi:DNA-binding MarR family transcriptional regulator
VTDGGGRLSTLDLSTYELYYSYVNNSPADTRTPTHATVAPDQTIFALLGAAHALEARLEDALARAGLSGPKFAVLNELVTSGDALALSELAARLSCVRSNMTQLIDRLESEGLVQRVACPSDRRLVKAEITYAGRDRQREGSAEIARLHEEFSANVQPADRSAIQRMLSALG